MANIQVASEGIPTPLERQITITGTPESVNKAEALIHDIVKEKECGIMGTELCTEEIMIPGPKVGMVIGKGGETIKRLQDAVCCKIIIVQDSHAVGASPKPLRIMGPPDAVARAKKMVEDILDSVDGGHGQVTISVSVPSDMVGMIIGKQGENIRRIQMDTNTKIQFAEENDSGYRTALLSGPESGARRAESMVKDMIAQRAQDKSGWNPPGVQTVKVGVPQTRTGVVIGKGGETIRLLQQQSGAHIELDRNEEAGQLEKFFVVRGTEEQIARAKQLIKEKTDPEGPTAAAGQDGYQTASGTGTRWVNCVNKWLVLTPLVCYCKLQSRPYDCLLHVVCTICPGSCSSSCCWQWFYWTDSRCYSSLGCILPTVF
jgi:far upstream element-binding protein